MDPYNDEISIGELIEKLWRKRGLIVFLPLVLAGLTVAGLLLTKATSAEKLSYYIELTASDKALRCCGAKGAVTKVLMRGGAAW